MSKDYKINAEPTKEFFITMLVKDIALHVAILDLIDNSIDGAIRLRGNNGDFRGLHIYITADESGFRISDNCGGFSVEVARSYAFRFGRPPGAPDLQHSVGRFGVGMKRALFKLGGEFVIQSTCLDSSFEIHLDVDEWKNAKDWDMEFAKIGASNPNGDCGTNIVVTKLHSGISEQFKLESFIDFLRKEIQKKNEEWIEKGISITVNGMTLSASPPNMYVSKHVMPAYLKMEHQGVNVRIYSGLSETGKPKEAGWYVYCNGRLVVQADKTEVTGWGTYNPMYHPAFAMFRGYVYFEAEQSNLLPWNTTKSGIDQDSEIYRAVLLEMFKISRPILDYLRKLKTSETDAEDKENSERERVEKIISAAELIKVSKIDVSSLSVSFKAPELNKVVNKKQTQTIQYSKPIAQIDLVKKVLGVTTLKDVGEKTFDYFYSMECDE